MEARGSESSIPEFLPETTQPDISRSPGDIPAADTRNMVGLEIGLALASVGVVLATTAVAMGRELDASEMVSRREAEQQRIREAEKADRLRRVAEQSEAERARRAENARRDAEATAAWKRRQERGS